MACAHVYVPSDATDYEVCVRCGTYHSTVAPPAHKVYTADYWSAARNHPTILEQVHNVDRHEEGGASKNAFLLDHIYTSGRRAALEIGCAPGVLLKRLREEAGFATVMGVEYDAAFYWDMRPLAGDAHFVFGEFPRVTASMPAGAFDLIVAADVFEHSHEPEAFLAACAWLLPEGGQLLLMLPVMCDALRGSRFFHPEQHVYMHSRENLTALLQDAGFGVIQFDRWCLGHDTVSARREGL